MKKTINSNGFKCASLLLIFVLAACSVMGQVKQKRVLKKEDYAMWSSLRTNAISFDGKWASYGVYYESGKDTLFLISTDSTKKYIYPSGKNPTFCGSKWFACITADNILELISLRSGAKYMFKNITHFEFSGDEKLMVFASKKSNQLQDLSIFNLESEFITKLGAVSSYILNTDLTSLAYSLCQNDAYFLTILSLNKNLEKLAELPVNGRVSSVVWQDNGKSVAFSVLAANNLSSLVKAYTKIGYYILKNKKITYLEPSVTKGFPQGKKIVFDYPSQLSISDDGLRILFKIAPITKTDLYSSADVEIWNGSDTHIYEERKMMGNLKDWLKTYVWYPDTNNLLNFMLESSTTKVSTNLKVALSADSESCGPQFKYDSDKTYFITDLTNGLRKEILNCHTSHPLHTYLSPEGKYIAYFKNGDWYSYDIKNDMHRNLTEDSGVCFYDEHDDKAGEKDVYALAGWSEDDKHIFVYDEYDLWQISTNGTDKKRVTNGREKKIEYRLNTTNWQLKSQTFVYAKRSSTINLGESLLFETKDYSNSIQGFSVLERNKLRSLLFREKNVSMIIKSAVNDGSIFIEETYEDAPKLVFKKNQNEKSKILFQSNPQQSNYFWGYNRIVNYTTASGINLKGLLYYPVNYVDDTKYPMLVQIYQQQFYLKNRYIPPTLVNSNGINITNYVTEGYFVFLPDIIYEVGSPGDSALECVSAGVEEVLKLGVVDSSKIGLTGHSFGGYETTYIIGKSNLFAAAVGGAAQTDLVSCYLSVSDGYKRSEFWRFEDYSNRMGKTLYADWSNYIYNSPITNAGNIETPLLLWTGDKDGSVSPKQSMEMYLALRRLEKKVLLLQYTNESHSITEERKQIDLTTKILDWFNYYLKDEPVKIWMLPNVNP